VGSERCTSYKLNDISGLTESKEERIKNIRTNVETYGKGRREGMRAITRRSKMYKTKKLKDTSNILIEINRLKNYNMESKQTKHVN
jgi:hypothetical protein